MRTKDLITLLQKLVDENVEYEGVMGEHEIVIDVFSKIGDTHQFEYSGFTPNIKVEKSGDGVYDIISAFKDE